MKCPNCVFMKGYEEADGMRPLQKTETKWVGWCTHCGALMTLEHGDNE